MNLGARRWRTCIQAKNIGYYEREFNISIVYSSDLKPQHLRGSRPLVDWNANNGRYNGGSCNRNFGGHKSSKRIDIRGPVRLYWCGTWGLTGNICLVDYRRGFSFSGPIISPLEVKRTSVVRKVQIWIWAFQQPPRSERWPRGQNMIWMHRQQMTTYPEATQSPKETLFLFITEGNWPAELHCAEAINFVIAVCT